MPNTDTLEQGTEVPVKEIKTKERVTAIEKEMALVFSKLENLTSSHQQLLQIHKCVEDSANNSKLVKRKPTAISIIKSHIADFYNNISLPGIKYMGENGRFDRYLWVFILILSIFVTSKYIEDAYKKWQDCPVLLSFNDSLTPISLIAFPAVTLCPPSQISLDYNLTDSIQRCHLDQDCNTTEWSKFQAARLFCPKAFSKFFNYYFRNPYMKENLIKYIRQVSSHCEDHLHKVTFPDAGQVACNQLLQTVFIDEKVCFTFNMLRAEDLFNDGVIHPMIDDTIALSKLHWSPDMMLQRADLYNTLPRHVDTNGERDQLVFIFHNHTDTHRTSCQHSYTNTKICFHNPVEVPTRQTHKFYSVSRDHNVMIRITPHLVTAENQLLKYTPDKRRCHFANEVKLALFRIYTQRNCQTECYINCTLSVCGCVPFYMPRLSENITLCTSLLDRKCIQVKLQGLIRDLWWQSSRPSQQIYKNKIKVFYTECICDCPADCTTLNYEADIEELTEEDQYSLDYGLSKILRISFQDYEFTSVVRKELIGLTDFIANSGGVLGVFTGFSFVALIELFYYLTLRLWVTIRHAWDRYDEDEIEELSSSLNQDFYKTGSSVQTIETFEI